MKWQRFTKCVAHRANDRGLPIRGSSVWWWSTVFFKRLYVLMHMHLATRRVLLAASTANPNEALIDQQARNLAWTLEEEGIKLKAVIHDRDKKFSASADNVLRSSGARGILMPLMAPQANATSSAGSEAVGGSVWTGCLW